MPNDAGSISPPTGEFKEGDQITFEAQPKQEWDFKRWEGAATGTDNPVTILIKNDETLRAVFEKKQYSLGISIDGEGKVREKVVTAKDYDINATVEVEAIPEEGWTFLEWSGDLSGSENPKQIQMDSPKNVVANFEIQTFPLELIVEGDGSIIKTPEKDVFNYAESVELRAESSERWQFDRWELDLSGSENPVSISITDTTEVRAVFSRVLYYLNVTSTNGGSVDINKLSGVEQNGHYSVGSEVELSANPNDGYAFNEWVGDASGSSNTIRIIIEDDTYIQANFSKNCLPVTNCILTDFYASTIIDNKVKEANISIKNILSENLTLNQISLRDEEGSLITQEDEIGFEIRSGESIGFSFNLDTEPLLSDFLEYKIEFFFEYDDKSYKVTQKAREGSSKSAVHTNFVDVIEL